jgi:hypothetical protein
MQHGMETFMSKGPGRVSRAIEAAIEGEPDNAFTIEDLCDRIYRGINQVEKKHRVSVLRAAKAIVARRPELDWMSSESLGGTLVVFNRYQVLSYAMARLKTNSHNRYRSNDKRDEWCPSAWYCKALKFPPAGKGKEWVLKKHNTDEAQLQALLSEGGANHENILPGGVWWRHVQENIAERDGDAERLAQLKAERERNLAATAAACASAVALAQRH